MKFFHKLQTHSGWGLLLLRLSVGAVFLYHGIGKWYMQAPENTETIFTILKFAEPLGGAALVLGFLTQLASLGLAVIMVGAIYFKAFVWNMGFAGTAGTGWEFDLILLAACLCLFFSGAGKLSADKAFMKG